MAVNLDDETTATLEKPLLGTGRTCTWLRSKRTSLFCIVSVLVVLLVFARFQLSQSRPRFWDQNLRPEFANEPLGKKTVRYFDGYLLARAGLDGPLDFQANVNRALAEEVEFESIAWGVDGGPLKTSGRTAWSGSGEEKRFRQAFGSTELFTQMLFFGGNNSATTASYGTLFWSGTLFGIPPANKWIDLRVCDFYRIKKDPEGIYGGLITYNFMMIDWADILHQAGHSVLPPPTLADGPVLPPAAHDGVPAPYSILAADRDSRLPLRVAESILRIDWAGSGEYSHAWHTDVTFYGPRGVGLARTSGEFLEHVLGPFRAAFANRTVVTEVLTSEGNYVAAMGHISGDHVAPWLGLPPSHKRVSIRFGMHWRVIDAKMKEGWAIFDLPGLFRQLGLNFFDLAIQGSAGKVTLLHNFV